MKPVLSLICGNALEIADELESESVNCIVTSPPYYQQRDYGVEGQLGLEKTGEEYIENLVILFRKLRRVLRADGSLWLNIGDSYATNSKPGNKVFGNPEFNKNRPSREQTITPAKSCPFGLKPKNLIGMPWRVAFALQQDGWYLRSDIVWEKSNALPQSVRDRLSVSHEYIFLLTKSANYYFDYEIIKEPARDWGTRDRTKGKHNTNQGSPTYRATQNCNHSETGRRKRTVWNVPTRGIPEANGHFATYPRELIRPCIQAGCPIGGTVLDPFSGSGTTGIEAISQNKNYIGIDLNSEYLDITPKRATRELRGVEYEIRKRGTNYT